MLALGVALVDSGHPHGDPVAAVGSLIAFVAMLLFAWLVFSRERMAMRGT